METTDELPELRFRYEIISTHQQYTIQTWHSCHTKRDAEMVVARGFLIEHDPAKNGFIQLPLPKNSRVRALWEPLPMTTKCPDCQHVHWQDEVHECPSEEYLRQHQELIEGAARAAEEIGEDELEWYVREYRREKHAKASLAVPVVSQEWEVL